jgi:lipopolysaccharide export system protein LptC
LLLPVTGGLMALSLLVSFETIPSPIGDIELGSIGVDGDTVTMDAPKLTGYGDKGMSYAVSASKAQQSLSTPNVVHLEEIQGRLDEDGGTWTSLRAERGMLDTEAETLRLDQEIELTTNDGKRAKLKSANVDFSKKTVTTDEAVEMEMDVGRVQAGSMSVSEGGKRILLRGNVSVDLRPDGMDVNEAAETQ